MRYFTAIIILAAFFMLGADATKAPIEQPPKDTTIQNNSQLDKFGDIRVLEKEALLVESRGHYEKAMELYWKCFEESVKAFGDAKGEDKLLEAALQEFYIEKAVCLTDDAANRPINLEKLQY